MLNSIDRFAIIMFMKRILSFMLIPVVLFSFVSCTNTAGSKEKYKKSFLDLFDTVSTVMAYDDSQEEFDRKYSLFYDELKTYNDLFDIYKHYEGVTNLYDVNKEAAKAPVKVDEKTIGMLLYGKNAYNRTDGKMNICLGSVLTLWHNEREYGIANPDEAKLPDASKLKEAAKHTDIDNLIIDTNNNTVYFKDPDMKLDVGAIAKGYAVEQITKWAKNNLWTSAAISVGGNVSVFGYKNDDGKTKWNIGIENPDISSDEYLLKLNITDECIVTSGDYQRFYTVDGKKYCHIINPETLMPSEYMASVSVICKDSALGDAMSTALFNMTVADGKKLVDSLDGIEAVWVDKEFNKTYSNGFEQFVDNDSE